MTARGDAMWHVIAGSTGAGKTTVARELSASVGGVCFSIDAWMNRLYWMDCPEKNDLLWALDRVGRCESQIAAMAQDLAEAGVSSILDLGFTRREQRTAWLERARAAGIPIVLHALDIAAEVRWGRVCERNGGAGATFTFIVTREMFDGMEAMWEPVSVEEKAAFDGT